MTSPHPTLGEIVQRSRVVGNVRRDLLLRAVDLARLEAAPVVDAARGLLARYVNLVECGDCGFWDPYEEADVIALVEALKNLPSTREPSDGGPPQSRGERDE